MTIDVYRGCKTTTPQSFIFINKLSYYFFSVEKLNAMTILIEAFGNSRTILNTTASRFSQLTTIDYDHSGQIVSASVQVSFDWLFLTSR